MATIKDVARLAGVSPATISHVVNGTRFVSQDVTDRVLAAMDELGYRPNRLARSLRIGATHTVGLIVPDISNHFFAQIACAVEDVLFENRYGVMLCDGHDDPVRQRDHTRTLIDKQVDGVLLISAGDGRDDLAVLQRARVPVVALDRDIGPREDAANPGALLVDTVLVDNELGGYLATRHLIELGHTHIACLSGPQSIPVSRQRVAGYGLALSEAGLPADLLQGDFHFPSGESAMRALLARRPRPTAVAVGNDMMAIGALREAHRQGVDVPNDVAIVGYDDIPLAPAVMPALTTVAQPTAEMARAAATLLLERMRQAGDEPQRIVFQPSLVVRDSTVPNGAGPKPHTGDAQSRRDQQPGLGVQPA